MNALIVWIHTYLIILTNLSVQLFFRFLIACVIKFAFAICWFLFQLLPKANNLEQE